MLALSDAFPMAPLHGWSSSSVSSISIEWSLVLFFGGALIIFAFAFSMRACLFLLTSGMVFEGSILATYKALTLLAPKPQTDLSHLFITYLHDITIAVWSILSRRSSKVFVVRVSLSIIHAGSLSFNRAPRLERWEVSGRWLSRVSEFIKLLRSNCCS